ncbi:MAG: hypothetical protein KGI49_02635 [Patescibacteria group bacterium]|nr:hypothetical protein [Patescibacteria group bacterium]
MTLKRMKGQASLYEAVKPDKFYWLWRHSLVTSWPNIQVREYDEMVRKVREFNRIKVLITWGMIFFFIGSVSAYAWWLVGNQNLQSGFTMIILFILIFLMVLLLVTLAAFRMRWDEFVDTWLDATWKTKNFADEVKVIVDTCSQVTLSKEELAENTKLPLSWFQGSGEEVREKKVPTHVIKACRRYLSHFALTIKCQEEPQPNETRVQKITRLDVITGYREWLRHVLEVYQRFGTLPLTEKLGNYYAEAEQTLAAEEAKKGEGRTAIAAA